MWQRMARPRLVRPPPSFLLVLLAPERSAPRAMDVGLSTGRPVAAIHNSASGRTFLLASPPALLASPRAQLCARLNTPAAPLASPPAFPPPLSRRACFAKECHHISPLFPDPSHCLSSRPRVPSTSAPHASARRVRSQSRHPSRSLSPARHPRPAGRVSRGPCANPDPARARPPLQDVLRSHDVSALPAPNTPRRRNRLSMLPDLS